MSWRGFLFRTTNRLLVAALLLLSHPVLLLPLLPADLVCSCTNLIRTPWRLEAASCTNAILCCPILRSRYIPHAAGSKTSLLSLPLAFLPFYLLTDQRSEMVRILPIKVDIQIEETSRKRIKIESIFLRSRWTVGKPLSAILPQSSWMVLNLSPIPSFFFLPDGWRCREMNEEGGEGEEDENSPPHLYVVQLLSLSELIDTHTLLNFDHTRTHAPQFQTSAKRRLHDLLAPFFFLLRKTATRKEGSCSSSSPVSLHPLNSDYQA